MEEKNSQENAIEPVETTEIIETAIDIKSLSSMKSDIIRTEQHHMENIDKIFVPQYIDDQNVNDNNCVVTYSKEDNSVLGWKINIEKNGPQQPEVYFNLNIHGDYEMFFSSLYRKVLIFCYSCEDERKYLLKYG